MFLVFLILKTVWKTWSNELKVLKNMYGYVIFPITKNEKKKLHVTILLLFEFDSLAMSIFGPEKNKKRTKGEHTPSMLS